MRRPSEEMESKAPARYVHCIRGFEMPQRLESEMAGREARNEEEVFPHSTCESHAGLEVSRKPVSPPLPPPGHLPVPPRPPAPPPRTLPPGLVWFDKDDDEPLRCMPPSGRQRKLDVCDDVAARRSPLRGSKSS
jgi:hypothetical protein